MKNSEPSPAEIWQRLEKIRDEHYPDLDLSQVKLEMSNRLTATAGKVRWWYNTAKQRLTISRKYHNRYGWGKELDKTIRHEIIHLAGYHDHGPGFQIELTRLNAKRFCKGHWQKPERTMYECQGCFHTFDSLNYETECPECGDLVNEIGTLEI